MAAKPAITTWNRLEPRPRRPEIKASLRAEIRDPLWLLARQWQLGELRGENAGTPAFVELSTRSVPLRTWQAGAAPVDIEAGRPLEPQALAEAFTPDLATRVELGQVFFRILGDILNPADLDRVKGLFAQQHPLDELQDDAFNPLDLSTRRLQSVVLRRAVDGVKIRETALSGNLPEGSLPADEAPVREAYGRFITWVGGVFGGIGTDPPAAWDPSRLDQSVTVHSGPAAAPATPMTMRPDADGTIQWSSFDLDQAVDPFAAAAARPFQAIPGHVRFPGMPANRYWDFEEGDLAFPEVDLEQVDLLKMAVVEFGLEYGVDWFVVPFKQALGTLVRIDSFVVRDVFGVRTAIARADGANLTTPNPPTPARWTLFSMTRPGGVADFHIVPPGAGPGIMAGPVLEDVRFARDEVANMAWAIERATESASGEPRSGPERDAAADAAAPPPPEPPATTAPIRYQVESKVPIHWVPLVPVSIPGRAPAIQLEKAAVLRPKAGLPAPVLSLGRILKYQPYLLPEEEVPRNGLRIERVVYRSRWTDGSTHLWVGRRRKAGAGETQSGLRFDAASSTVE